MRILLRKVRRKLWAKVVSLVHKKVCYPYLYKSFWHANLFRINYSSLPCKQYLSCVPNPGAGIGHQLANWIAGFWFAKEFGLQFAHIPFASNEWDSFLGFGEGEIRVDELISEHGYKKVLLPLFDEKNPKEIAWINKIIRSYQQQKVVFICEQDQSYKDQFGIIENIKEKFYSAKARQKDKLIYSKENFNIAVHVRRGDIVIGQKNKKPNLLLRWQDNSYFEKVLKEVIENISTDKPITTYVFSQGSRSDFQKFEKFDNLHYCLEMNAQQSFLHLVFADLIITSKSSFSYKPALLNNGIKVCPVNFWHGYPKADDWVLVDDNADDVNVDLSAIKG